jgi:hypothetical protein
MVDRRPIRFGGMTPTNNGFIPDGRSESFSEGRRGGSFVEP